MRISPVFLSPSSVTGAANALRAIPPSAPAAAAPAKVVRSRSGRLIVCRFMAPPGVRPAPDGTWSSNEDPRASLVRCSKSDGGYGASRTSLVEPSTVRRRPRPVVLNLSSDSAGVSNEPRPDQHLAIVPAVAWIVHGLERGDRVAQLVGVDLEGEGRRDAVRVAND